MTRRTNARLAGFTFLFYIGIGVASMVIAGSATGGTGIAGKLTAMAQHPTAVRITILLALLQGISAMVLGVALYGLTRDEDHDLAMLSLAFRIGEGVLGAFPLTTLGLFWLARTQGGPGALDGAAASALGVFLQSLAGWKTTTGAIFFAAGSTLFSWLLLRGRMIPLTLAWIGIAASVLLVIALPLQLVGILRGTAAQMVWLPMAAFEIPLAIWLLVKGVAVRPASPGAIQTWQ